ncbi:hypothetical protein FOA52_002820 [Chlamydomonas sp. UWO 241]|nr:hypothetical protein FOA52_002820 [Chlamydomonas sp. UWO 241]
MSADELKAKGNAAFSAASYPEAIEFFTQAIAVDPKNHVLFSNRSAAKASLKEYDGALQDAQECVSLKPDWAKGYSRLGAAYYGMEDYQAAGKAYTDGLVLDPTNDLLKTGLADSQAAAARPSTAKSPFSRPEFMAKLAMDPRTRPLLGTPAFMAMLSDVQSNVSSMNKYLGNPHFQVMLELAFGFKFGDGDAAMSDPPAAGAHDHEHGADGSCMPGKSGVKAPEPAAATPAGEVPAHGRLSTQAAALKEKEAGNAAYKAKDFPTAIAHYNKAMELDDTDISFTTNRSAVYFEMGDYAKCIEDCDTAVERGRELRADYKLVAKALTRKGSALMKLSQFEDAIAVFGKSLMEHRTEDTLKKLHDAEKALKAQREGAYVDMELCAVEREKGNQAFKDMKYPEAVAAYSEALQRGPPSVNPDAYKLYSNLAACYTKLCAYPEGVKAADRCIELMPSFAKGYSRKGTLQFFMKEYDKAIATYQIGLGHDPENAELKEGIEGCLNAIGRFASGEASKEEIAERQARSMADPEVQALLKDPIMQNILRDFQENPKAAQAHLKSPEIMKKLEKLIAAGIIQLK